MEFPTWADTAAAVVALITATVTAVGIVIAVTVALRVLGKNAPWIERGARWVWLRLVGEPLAERRAKAIAAAVETYVAPIRSELSAISATVGHINGAVNCTPAGEPTLNQIARLTHVAVLAHTAELAELGGKVDDLTDALDEEAAHRADMNGRLCAVEEYLTGTSH